jgi:hypothetical protein
LALQGSLDTFALPDVLRLLATTAKTGRLRIEGDRGHGSVWLRDGTVMAATADRAVEDAPAEEVLFELLRFDEGSFAFDMDELSPNGEQPEDVEILLRNAGSLLSEWSELESIVPSLDHRVRLVNSLPKGDVTIDSRRWPSLVAVASGRTVRDVASTLALSELGVTRAVRDLVDIGVAEIEEPGEDATIPPAPRRERPRATSRDVPRDVARDAARDVPRDGSRDVPRDEIARRSPFSSLGSGETLATSMPRTDGVNLDDDIQQAGWLQSPEHPSGSQPTVPDGLTPTANNGRGTGASGNGSGPHGAPGAPGAPGGSAPGSDIPSRLGRSASGSGPGSGAGSAAGAASGSGSSKRSGSGRSSGSSRSSGSGRTSGPSRSSSSRSAGSGRSSGSSKRPGRSGAGASGSSRDPSGESRRRAAPGGPSASGNGEPPSRMGKTRPPSSPRRNGPSQPPVLPDTGPLSMPPVSPNAFDAGPLGPSPLPADTGQIRPVSPSALPPDLQWAVDDEATAGVPPAGPLGTHSFGNGGPNGGGLGANPAMAGPPIDPNKIAPHVAAMSPEARVAVQGTVGNTGGADSGLGPGDELAQRGQLLNFLSSVKP